MAKRYYSPVLLPRFRDIELRIGTTDESEAGLTPLTGNPLVGNYTDPKDEHVASFLLDPRATGRFLTLQSFHDESLEVNEIEVYL